ncbi:MULTISPECIES: hypothetical protein [Cytobacillus]|uniref:hypothetical protein n=1 Tax=Cytobacillus TaxID=2675230 RepID=UPI002041CFFC|nr:hypothetical protein [Cytobacillus firmus]MCM3707959.1 hypothetical protein [Cytobacillus firmus]
MERISIRITLMAVMTAIFLSYVVYVFTYSGEKSFGLMTAVSIVGLVLSLIGTYSTKKWLSFIFIILPIFILSVSFFVYSILNLDKYATAAFYIIIFIYLVRLIMAGWTKENQINQT